MGLRFYVTAHTSQVIGERKKSNFDLPRNQVDMCSGCPSDAGYIGMCENDKCTDQPHYRTIFPPPPPMLRMFLCSVGQPNERDHNTARRTQRHPDPEGCDLSGAYTVLQHKTPTKKGGMKGEGGGRSEINRCVIQGLRVDKNGMGGGINGEDRSHEKRDSLFVINLIIPNGEAMPDAMMLPAAD